MIEFKPMQLEDVPMQAMTADILNQLIITRSAPNVCIFIGDYHLGTLKIAQIYLQALNYQAAENIQYAANLTRADWENFISTNLMASAQNKKVILAESKKDVPKEIFDHIMSFIFYPANISLIESTLCQLCEQNHYTDYKTVCSYVAKQSMGYIELAIEMLNTYLEQHNSQFKDLKFDLLWFSYETQIAFLKAISEGQKDIVESIYAHWKDQPKNIISNMLLVLCCDIINYREFLDMSICNTPACYESLIASVDIPKETLLKYIQDLSRAY